MYFITSFLSFSLNLFFPLLVPQEAFGDAVGIHSGIASEPYVSSQLIEVLPRRKKDLLAPSNQVQLAWKL
jgi:hypothetical protein